MKSKDETRFLATVAPLVQSGDRRALLATLEENWLPDRLVQLFASRIPEVVRCAAVGLGCVGSMSHACHLASLLGHADGRVAAAAEEALWTLWMQAGSPGGNAQLARAVHRIGEDDDEGAIAILRGLLEQEPGFAEAAHQLAIAHHALDQLDDAEAAYLETICLNPYHFAALAGLGHIHFEQRDLVGALRYYRRALGIHPRLEEIRALVPRLQAAIDRRSVA